MSLYLFALLRANFQLPLAPNAARPRLVCSYCTQYIKEYGDFMLSEDLTKTALELSPEDRLELARRLVESVGSPLSPAVLEGVRRLEDMAAGRVTGLTEEEFRKALQ